MGFFEFATVAVVFGSGVAVICTFIDKVFGDRKEKAKLEFKATQERARMLEAQLIESQRHGDMLQKQLEWHTKMLETQDRLMKQLADGGSARPRVGSAS